MLGFSLLLHASPIGCKKTGTKMWYQGCWNDKVMSLPFFTGFLIKLCQESSMMKTSTLQGHTSAGLLHERNIF